MNIAILGCGWLGFPLAKHLISKGDSVKGSVRRRARMQDLREVGINPYLLEVFPEGVKGDMTAFLAHAHVLLIALPPGLRIDPKADFVGKIKRILGFVEKSPVEKVLFIGTTSVYKDSPDFPSYTEKDPAQGETITARQLRTSEKLLRNNVHFKATILRFGGLIGPGRHPIKQLAGRKAIKNPEAPVNLIHQEDCINAIHTILKEEAWGETYNAVFPEHPEKEAYYLRLARKKDLPIPEFDHSRPSVGKYISSDKIREELGFKYQRSI